MRNLGEIMSTKQISSKELYSFSYMGKYNYWLIKKINMEQFIKENTVDECKKYEKFFSKILRELEICIESLEVLLDRKLTNDEKSKGFEI